jgi:hypothetical protein
MTPAATPVTAAIELRQALAALGDALAECRLEALVTLDVRLAHAVTALRAIPIVRSTTGMLREELVATRRELARCRRLGDGLSAFVRASLAANATGAGYEPVPAAAVLTGNAINARV